MPQRTILLAEDNTRLRVFLAEVLEAAGYAVLQAAHGAAALALVDGCDLLLLDLRMAPISGVQVLDAVRRRRSTRTLPVVILTGKATLELPVFASPHTISAILLKPVDPDVLVLTVDSVLGHPRGGECGDNDDDNDVAGACEVENV